MKKKCLFLFVLVCAVILLPITIGNNTNSNSSNNNYQTGNATNNLNANNVTLKSGVKGYIGKEAFNTPNSDGFGMSYTDKSGNNESLGSNNNERFVTIRLHSGDLGYFESEGQHVDVVESIQFKGDTFYDVRVPTPNDSSYMFLGWAKTEGATTPDIEIDGSGVKVDTVGEDLYAVWTNQCSAVYNAGAGYFEDSILNEDGVTEIDRNPGTGRLMVIKKTYTCGANFENIIPTNNHSDRFDFEGWYDTHDNLVTTSTKIKDPEFEVRSNWIFKLDQIQNIFDDIPLGQEKNISTTEGVNKFYKLIPTETAIYDIYIKDSTGTGVGTNSPKIAIYNENGKQLALPNPDGDAVTTFFKFEKGKNYVIEFGEQAGHQISFTAGIKEAEYKTVTFHSNRGGETYFGEPGVTEIEVPYSEGEVVQPNDKHGLSFVDPKHLNFYGWVTEPDGQYDPDGEIVVTEDIDVYADYYETDSMILNAGDGIFTTHGGATSIEYKYIKGSPFDPAIMAKANDNTKAFAGWSRNQNATEPDEDILEEVTIADDIEGPLYAVYTDKILETWDANGGYFMQDPSVTTYTSTKGVGHDFWGMALYHDDSRVVPLGWKDQDNEFIPYTPNAYAYYHNKGDTYYTAVWGRQIILDANGGTFENFEGATALYGVFEYDEVFTLDDYKEVIGRVIPDDALQYLAGWATTQDATEPDVIEGETPVKDLTRVYAVWKDDTYYFAKGKNSSWVKGSDSGLNFIIKRQGDDTDTYDTFHNVIVDGNRLTSSSYTRNKGSLILTLKPEYLETLDLGEHEIEFTFMGNKSIMTTLTIKEKGSTPQPTPDDKSDGSSKKGINPKTNDNILFYISLLGLGLIGLTSCGLYIRKRKISS